jgi:hypothetical protein
MAEASGPEQLQMNPSGIAGPASFVVGAELALLDELELDELEPQALKIPATRATASTYLKRISTSPPSESVGLRDAPSEGPPPDAIVNSR